MTGKDIIVTFKDGTTDEQVKAAKDKIVAQGGKIGHEYTLIKGFSATLPEDHISTLASDPCVQSVENDGKVTTQ